MSNYPDIVVTIIEDAVAITVVVDDIIVAATVAIPRTADIDRTIRHKEKKRSRLQPHILCMIIISVLNPLSSFGWFSFNK